MPKIVTSKFVNWEHRYIYPLVIKDYDEPAPNPYKPKSDKIDSDLGKTIHDIKVKETKLELELKNLKVEGAVARAQLLQSADLDEEELALAEEDVILGAESLNYETEERTADHEEAPWRYNILEEDMPIAAPRSYSMPDFKKV